MKLLCRTAIRRLSGFLLGCGAMVYRRRLGVFVKMEAETRRTEFLFAEIASRHMELAQARAAVVAESAGRATARRA